MLVPIKSIFLTPHFAMLFPAQRRANKLPTMKRPVKIPAVPAEALYFAIACVPITIVGI